MNIGVDFEANQIHQCEICVAGKLVQKPFNLNRATSILKLVYSDVCQVEDLSIGKAKYYITFLDDHSRKIFMYFLKHKDEVPETVRKFIKSSEKQTGHKVKILRRYNGREYVNANLRSILDDLGVKYQTSIAYQPQQNGRAERVNRVLLEKARCMLAESKLAYKFGQRQYQPLATCQIGAPRDVWLDAHLKKFGRKETRFIQPQNFWMQS